MRKYDDSGGLGDQGDRPHGVDPEELAAEVLDDDGAPPIRGDVQPPRKED